MPDLVVVHMVDDTVERWTEPVVKISGRMIFVATSTRSDELPLTLRSAPSLPCVYPVKIGSGRNSEPLADAERRAFDFV